MANDCVMKSLFMAQAKRTRADQRRERVEIFNDHGKDGSSEEGHVELVLE